MKTLHQHLLEADWEAIFEHHLQRRKISPCAEKSRALQAKDSLDSRRQIFMRFSEELLNLTPVQNEKMVFLATEEFIDGCPDNCPILISLEDLNNGAARNIDWRTTDRDKLMGFLVADTRLTQDISVCCYCRLFMTLILTNSSGSTWMSKRRRWSSQFTV